jgi:hypothetical protein
MRVVDILNEIPALRKKTRGEKEKNFSLTVVGRANPFLLRKGGNHCPRLQ